MKRSRLLAAVFVLGAVSSACSDPEHSGIAAIDSVERITVDNVRSILEESPDEFVIGVQEVLDDAGCYKEWGNTCLVKTQIVDYLAGEMGRSIDRQRGWTYYTREAAMKEPWSNRTPGRHRLIIGYPNKNQDDSYGNRLFIVDPTVEAITRLQEVIVVLRREGFELSTA